jgi:F0F1-type ATP synthase membrane subunit b/b'
MEVKMETFRFVFQAIFFGIFLGFLQVFGIPFLNKNKKDKK